MIPTPLEARDLPSAEGIFSPVTAAPLKIASSSILGLTGAASGIVVDGDKVVVTGGDVVVVTGGLVVVTGAVVVVVSGGLVVVSAVVVVVSGDLVVVVSGGVVVSVSGGAVSIKVVLSESIGLTATVVSISGGRALCLLQLYSNIKHKNININLLFNNFI